MRVALFFLSGSLIAVSACSSSSRTDQHTYTLQGQVLSIDQSHREATIRHEDIKGFMPAMTMPYKLKDPKLFDRIEPGDLITAQLVVVPNDAYLTSVNKVGTAPLEKAPANTPAIAAAGSGLLQPGDAVPNAHFVDQDGKDRDFASFKGSPVVVTFIYTKCPVPTFCPLMDRQFAQLQRTMENDSALKKVRLISVSFDPLTDTPPVLKQHARELKADPARWTFLTGQRDAIDRFAAHFGVSVARAPTDATDITHNLRTAIVDSAGKVVTVYTGNEWSPEQVITAIKSLG